MYKNEIWDNNENTQYKEKKRELVFRKKRSKTKNKEEMYNW